MRVLLALLSVFIFPNVLFAGTKTISKKYICRCTKTTDKRKKNRGHCYLPGFHLGLTKETATVEDAFIGKKTGTKKKSGHKYSAFEGFSFLDPHYIFQFFIEEIKAPTTLPKTFVGILSATGEASFEETFDCTATK